VSGKYMGLRVLMALALGLGLSSCNKSGSGGSASSGASGDSASAGPAAGGPQVSGAELEAENAAIAELQKHWTKGPNGWTSAIVSGSPYAPDRYLRQFRDLTVERVESYDLTDADKMNGFDWAGEVLFKRSPGREAGDSGILFDGNAGMIQRQPGRWSQWVDFQASAIKVQKQKGKWQVDTDTMLLRGHPPTAADYAKAGVKE